MQSTWPLSFIAGVGPGQVYSVQIAAPPAAKKNYLTKGGTKGTWNVRAALLKGMKQLDLSEMKELKSVLAGSDCEAMWEKLRKNGLTPMDKVRATIDPEQLRSFRT